MMRVSVITPPQPIVLPEQIAGTLTSDPALVAAMIQAATEEIDGPSGWVGRCFGPQELELRLDSFATADTWGIILLPYPPLIDVVSVKYDDLNGVEQSMPNTAWRSVEGHGGVAAVATSWPSTSGKPGCVRIRYRAGYDGAEGRGPVPERARQAVILGTRALMGMVADGMLRSEQIEGVGTRSFVGADVAAAALRTASERLLSTLLVYA